MNKEVYLTDRYGTSGGLRVYIIDEEVYIEPIGSEEDLTDKLKELIKHNKAVTNSMLQEWLEAGFATPKKLLIKELKEVLEMLEGK